MSSHHTNVREIFAGVPTPLISYHFPCSFLGKPGRIRSSLPVVALGTLRPPTLPNSTVSTTFTSPVYLSQNDSQPSEDSESLSSFSCPRHTIDGIASEIILESEKTVANLRSYYLGRVERKTQANTGDGYDDSTLGNLTLAPGLALELWFTPSIERIPESFLPIVSIGTPLAETNEVLKPYTRSSIRHDPCENNQLAIGQRGEILELVYRDHYEYLPERFSQYDDGDDFSNTRLIQYSCRVLRLTKWKLGDHETREERTDAVKGLHHLVISWRESGSILQVFGNGQLIADINLLIGAPFGPPNPNGDLMRYWNPSFRLQIFSDSTRWLERTGGSRVITSTNITNSISDGTNTNIKLEKNKLGLFSGTFHEIALYNKGLGKDTVGAIYEVGLKKREDPFKIFFEDNKNPFEPIRLVASSVVQNSSRLQDVALAQGSSTLISVGAAQDSNTTTALWDVLVELVDVPKYGVLVFYNESRYRWEKEYCITAQVGDRFLLKEGSLQTKLEYRHLKEMYFTIPKQSYYGADIPVTELASESFAYRLVATRKKSIKDEPFEPSSQLVGRSDAVRQELTIVHKNHPPALEGLPKTIQQPQRQVTGMGARPWGTLGTDVVLNDEKDYDIDRVRLYLWAHNGTLTIDLKDIEVMDVAEITACSNPKPKAVLNQEWICDGQNDRNMTLLVTPTNASRILSNLRYKALQWNTSDSIALRIYDGSGGFCPNESDQVQHSTIRDECFSIAASVAVPPISRFVGRTYESIWKDHRSWWITLVIFLVFLSLVCCCAIACWKRCRRIKNLNDIAVADCDKQNVVLAFPEEVFPSSIGMTDEDRRAANCLQKRDVKGVDFSV